MPQRESAYILHLLNDLFRGQKYRIDHATIQLECSQSQMFVCNNGCCFRSVHTQDRSQDYAHEQVQKHTDDYNQDHTHEQNHDLLMLMSMNRS
jgi:hypothetical protein